MAIAVGEASLYVELIKLAIIDAIFAIGKPLVQLGCVIILYDARFPLLYLQLVVFKLS